MVDRVAALKYLYVLQDEPHTSFNLETEKIITGHWVMQAGNHIGVQSKCGGEGRLEACLWGWSGGKGSLSWNMVGSRGTWEGDILKRLFSFNAKPFFFSLK